MCTAILWNKKSPNYDKNQFVQLHGTGCFEVKDETEALKVISQAVRSVEIEKLELILGTGRLIWIRNQDVCTICGLSYSSQQGDCRECPNCQNELKAFTQDIEECDDEEDNTEHPGS